MFLAQKHIPRRTFLRAAGVTVALPLLDAMLPAQTPLRKTAANAKTRFTGIFVPHGAAPGYWSPATPGMDFEFSPITKPLEPFRDRVVILSGLYAKSSEQPAGESGGDHSVSAAFMAANRPKKTAGADIHVGKTIDQYIAGKIGQDTLLPSMQLAIEDPGGNTGTCGWGYSCSYVNTISWSAPNTPLPMEINPQIVFERLFGDGSTPEERQAQRLRDGSILDSVTDKLKRLLAKVGPADRHRLNEYLEDIRETERRLKIAREASATTVDAQVPFGVPEKFDDHIKLQFDLQYLAFRGDVTRVSTLLYARDVSGSSYPESGTNSAFHGASHHGEDPKRVAEYARINTYHVKCLAHFVQKLQSTAEGDGTLLDHCLILYGSNMGDSNQHQHYDCPHVLIGGASGRLKGGRHLEYPTRTISTGNLLLSILDMYDIHLDNIGTPERGGSTGRLTDL